jgi:1-acyl-sn-glycerol-3-phosphate acyltransferase
LSLRVVLKTLMRLDPAIDMASERLSWCFVGGSSGRARRGVAEVARELKPGDALLLFPEGGNFTRRRWRESVRHLAERGDYLRARAARRRTHTLPLRPGGAVAALRSAPGSSVMLIAHCGFARDGRDRRWWRLPVGRDFVVRSYLIPADDVPRGEAALHQFLDRCWATVEAWVESRCDLEPVSAHGDAPASPVG